ncbi:hypothetical protein GDO78_022763, partial [Eleutherodactylus coqui]
MEHPNHTHIKDFILTGFSQNLQTCILIFVIFLVIYILTILGNSFLISIVIISPPLHAPMYYFLCNLSFLDLCFSSCIAPKMLFDTLSKERRISLIGCLTQMTFGVFLARTECILLCVMAYDRYVAICLPLHYTVIMSWRACRYITVIMWSGSFTVIIIHILKPLVFCVENTLNHFACEALTLLDVACGNLSFYKIALLIGGIFLLSSLTFIVLSYIWILISVFKIHSAGSRSKAFSTCASHLVVVSLFFGTIIIVYTGQVKGSTSNLKYISLIYAVLPPVINPLIYSLRNRDVKEAFQKFLLIS